MRLVLSHAWVNRCDTHMTTGRVNQVAVRNILQLQRPFQVGSERTLTHVNACCVILLSVYYKVSVVHAVNNLATYICPTAN